MDRCANGRSAKTSRRRRSPPPPPPMRENPASETGRMRTLHMAGWRSNAGRGPADQAQACATLRARSTIASAFTTSSGGGDVA